MKRIRPIPYPTSDTTPIVQKVVPIPYKGPVPPFSLMVHPDNQSQWDKTMEVIQEGIAKHGNFEGSVQDQMAHSRRKDLNDDGVPRYGYQLPPETDEYCWKIGDNPRINPKEGEEVPVALLRVSKVVKKEDEDEDEMEVIPSSHLKGKGWESSSDPETVEESFKRMYDK